MMAALSSNSRRNSRFCDRSHCRASNKNARINIRRKIGFARGTSHSGRAKGEKFMAGNGIIEVTDANFDQDVLKSETPVLVDFWATWCGPCRAIAPIVEELAKDYQGKVKIGKMDVDHNSATPMRYGVRGIPTLLVFKGGQVKEQIVGYVPKEQIQKALDKHIG
jgi:thioredoxin 1